MASSLPPTLRAPIGAARLVRNTSRSFTLVAGTLADVTEWLMREHGFQPIPLCSPAEYARLRNGPQLAVVYRSGSTVAQGDDWPALVALLDELVGPDPQQAGLADSEVL